MTMKRMLILLLPLCLLAGCWDRNEINEMAIVMGTALDKQDEENIELSVQIIIPQSIAMGSQEMGSQQGGQGMKNTLIVSSSGKTIYDAAAKVQEHLPRRLFWGHNRILVIGEELAKHPFSHHIDFFIRHPQPRLRTKLFVSKGKAKDILAVMPPLETTSSKAAQVMSRLRFGLQVTIMDYLRMDHSESKAAALPWLEITPSDPNVGETEPENLWISGSAIIKNGQLVGIIDDETTRGLLWILDEIKMAEVTFEPRDAQGKLSVQIIRSRTRLIPELRNGKWRMIVQVDTHDDIVENQSNLDLEDPRTIDELEQDVERAIAQRIRQAVEQVQKNMKADCFGFANVIYQKYPKEWQQIKDRWETVFPDIDVDIRVTAKIKRYGMATHSQGISDEEVKRK